MLELGERCCWGWGSDGHAYITNERRPLLGNPSPRRRLFDDNDMQRSAEITDEELCAGVT